MGETFILYLLQSVTAILFAAFAFFLRGIFGRLDESARRINKLEVANARNASENETLFHRLDRIEKKLDRILENWRTGKT